MFGDIVGAITGPLGALYGASRQRKHEDKQQARGMDYNERTMEANFDFQREFAQNALQWRAADARAAGINPVTALGANSLGGTPVSVGNPFMGNTGNSFGEFEAMGQGISRAIRAASNSTERKIMGERLENMELKNEILEMEKNSIRKRLQTSSNPPMAGTEIIPNTIIKSAPGIPSQEAGKVTDLGFSQTQTGLTPVPSKDVKEKIEDQLIPELMWAIRNYVAPFFGQGKPSKTLLPKGNKDWRWNALKFEWQPAKRKKKKPEIKELLKLKLPKRRW